MNTLAIIFTCLLAMSASGLLLAGLCSLILHDEAELSDFRHRLEHQPSRTIRDKINRYIWVRREVLPLSLLIAHWKTRQAVRRMILIGIALAAAALICGSFATIPS